MQLRYSDIPLPYLVASPTGQGFPPFKQYYEDVKTTFALLFVFSFPRLRYLLRLFLFLISDTGDRLPASNRTTDNPIALYEVIDLFSGILNRKR